MKNKIKGIITKKVEDCYFEIEETNGALIFHLKNSVKFSKKYLIVKHKKTGKRLVIPIKKSKAILNNKHLEEIGEFGHYDIYLKVNAFNRDFLQRMPYNVQDKDKVLLDENNNTIFEIQPTNNKLTFYLGKNSFYPKLNTLNKTEKGIILKGEIKPFNNLKFDEMKIISKSNRGGRREFKCKYTIEDEKILFETNLKLNDIDENEIDSHWSVNLRLKKDDIIIDTKGLRCNNLSPLKFNKDFSLEKESYGEINNNNICVHYIITNKNYLRFEIITEDKYETKIKNHRHKDIYNKYKTKTLNKNYIFFESFHGKYNNSPKYIYEKMLEMGYDKKYTFIWAYEGNEKLPGNPVIVNEKEEDYYKYLAQSKYKINSTTFPVIDKREDVVYLQTWHGTPLKKVGRDVNGGVGWRHFNKEVPTWNYLISANKYSTKTFERAFNFKKEILELGYPANDIFYKKDKSFKDNIKNKLNIPKNKNIILYAPTFRDDKRDEKGDICFKLDLDLETLYEHLKEDYILIIKTHSVVSNELDLDNKFEDFIIDLSNYEDIHELFVISDILITDYSSSFFDFAHSKKPILFFMPDLKKYKSKRGLYEESLDDLPGPKLTKNEELIKSILSINKVQEDYNNKYEKFYKKYCNIGKGNSSEEIINKMLGK